tara:strand:- start:105 stop:482 length:378 start_codon:yes stop_codon:yes gene_type:complete
MKIVNSIRAPKAIGTYSQAIKSKDYVFTSGQIGINPITGEMVDKDFKLQAAQAFKNLENILIDSGSSINKIVKLNIYLTDLDNFDILNSLLLDILDKEKLPARATVQVSRLPKDAYIEVDAIAEI